MGNVKVGDRIKLIRKAESTKFAGEIGIITLIDEMGNIHGTWSGYTISPDKDQYEILWEA